VRILLPLALLLVSASLPAARAAGEATARERLAVLDRGGGASEVEIVRLASEWLARSPDDTTLLWRRGDALRRLGQDERALADLQRLIQLAPASPYAVRARRALPALFLRVGLDREAAQADEELLAQKLADPVAVLPRLAQTYSRLGQAGEVRATIERLRAIDRERATGDCDLAWLEADAIARLGPRSDAAAAMLAFATRFPNDRRRAEALERAGRSPEAGDDVRTVLATSSDPGTIERALSRYVEIEQEQRGTEGAIVALAGLASEVRPAVAGPAKRRMTELLEGLAASRKVAPERAAFLVELAGRAGPGIEVPPALRLAAAQLWEGVGDCGRASRVYRSLVSEGPPVELEAERGLERCRPRAQPSGPAAGRGSGGASSP